MIFTLGAAVLVEDRASLARQRAQIAAVDADGLNRRVDRRGELDAFERVVRVDQKRGVAGKDARRMSRTLPPRSRTIEPTSGPWFRLRARRGGGRPRRDWCPSKPAIMAERAASRPASGPWPRRAPNSKSDRPPAAVTIRAALDATRVG